MIHVLIGTKAEYIKTAPVMRELDRRGVPYRLVDLGQHSNLSVSFRTQAGMGGVCLVHGDTPSTIIATLLGRRAGVPVAHLESGLRSKSAVHPFPEELTRRGVMRLTSTYFPPNGAAGAKPAGPLLQTVTSFRPGTTRPRRRSATSGQPSPPRGALP
ncbi:MAG: UDP-N-acetylglucosamine 2-epimerase [Candidatus Microthrix sp.]|nr:UDP-N-acetylglucosamine 2-epimerase [Candidatus Microthrix sp.]